MTGHDREQMLLADTVGEHCAENAGELLEGCKKLGCEDASSAGGRLEIAPKRLSANRPPSRTRHLSTKVDIQPEAYQARFPIAFWLRRATEVEPLGS